MWAVLVGIVAVILFQQSDLIVDAWEALQDSSLPTVLIVAVVVAVFPVAFGLGWLLSLPWWRAAGYRVTGEEIAVRRGVFSRQLRTARFDRVHAIDLVEPLAARLFRLAGVSVETAGGSDSSVSVEYLPRADAEELRASLLRLVNGTPDDADDRRGSSVDAAGSGVATAAEDSAAVIVAPIPITRSIAASALSGATVGVIVAVVVSIVTPAGLALFVPVAVGVVPWLWGILNSSWRFTARLSGDVLGVTFGLTERRRQSVPLGRIHAVEVSQPILWRMLGWWKVKVDIAGYGAEDGKSGSTTTLLPVGDLNQTLRVLTLLAPLSADQVTGLAHPEGLQEDAGTDAGSTVVYRSPHSARWVSPLDRTRQGVTLVAQETDGGEHSQAPRWQAVISHHGRLRRVVSVIAPAHIQELSLRRGPVQQLLGLSGVQLDLVPGPVSMTGRDLVADDAVDLVTRLRSRALPGRTN
ncbi:MAG TPA: PH domain-containing protein [Candidatus Corynebacterium avicola]|uniref:PH domain-containing protein n=1 Tax=Candidatus Corynebacterium avicola TaxID=2838527 RepID=A0A9D1RU60_9CORY|nr:PH domain-containing protein [Candidatus Corynebacterium avicola]